jgi:hypothetical protein
MDMPPSSRAEGEGKMKLGPRPREAPDGMLLSFQDLGQRSVAYLRETLGQPSTDGVRPLSK